MNISPPDVVWPMTENSTCKSSWTGHANYINDEHQCVWEQTGHIPGWQDVSDTTKLYEMAFHNGSVILEIGTYGGRSAAVELRGALAAFARRSDLPPPQFFGVDVDPEAIVRTLQSLKGAGLEQHALLYRGMLRDFHRDIPIIPTMVFVDGDHNYAGVWADLEYLSRILSDGTPVLCHDYIGINDVTRAVNEWVASGRFRAVGQFGCSALLAVVAHERPAPRGLAADCFRQVRQELLDLYCEGPVRPHLSLASDVSRACRRARLEIRSTAAPVADTGGLGPWPYAAHAGLPLPPTLPGGRPWPKISIVTPTFNYGQYLEETLLSVAHQEYPNVEHIVIDGGSTDQTAEILERHRHRLAAVVSEPDRGQSHAINKGFSLATGEIFTWINGDDILAPGALAAMALAFHESGADMVAGICDIHEKSFAPGHLVERHLTSCADGPLPLADLLDLDNCWMRGQFFMQPEVMFTRALWEKAGGHVEESLFYSMDYELWLRFAHADARIHAIGRSIAWFRRHERQKTLTPERFVPELRQVRDSFIARTQMTFEVPPITPPRARPLRIACVNDIGFRFGAGIAHGRMAKACMAAGHHVEAYMCAMEANDATSAAPLHVVVDALVKYDPELVIVGNLHGAALDIGLVDQLASRFPTAQVIHDQWAVTGRCAYTGTCDKYLRGCDDSCPTAPEYPSLPLAEIAGAWKSKYEAYTAASPPLLLGNSRWMTNLVEKAIEAYASGRPGLGGRSAVRTIALPCETDVFTPRDRVLCRELLDLPQDEFIILCSASRTDDHRKGLTIAIDALTQLDLAHVTLVCLGAQSGTLANQGFHKVHMAGYIEDPRKLAMLYSAADLFLGPSREEALGQVFVEAAACGTPSIGFAVGGVTEALVPEVSGRVVYNVSADGLADAIYELYTQPELRAHLSAWGRIHVENERSLASCYRDLFVAMGQTGVLARLGFSPKISLSGSPSPQLAPPHVLPAARVGWMAFTGFGPWEGPYPEHRLPRCRWLLGARSRLALSATQAGNYRVILRYASLWTGRRLRVMHRGKFVLEVEIPQRDEQAECTLHFDLQLSTVPEHVDLEHWPWDPGTAGNAYSVLLYDVAIVKLDGEASHDSSGERMLAGTYGGAASRL